MQEVLTPQFSLDYGLWNEWVHCINWNQIRTQTMLIEGRKRSITKVGKKIILNSTLDFTVRLKQMEETIFIKRNIVFCAEFEALLFDKKTYFFSSKNRGEIFEMRTV